MMVWRWSRWPLFWRLYGALLLVLAVVGGVFAWLELRATHNAELQRLRLDLETAALIVSPVVVEAVLTGDQARLLEALQNQVDANPGIAALTWEYNGTLLRATGRQPAAPSLPAWWRRAAVPQPERHAHEVQVGGVSYGWLRVEGDTSIVAAASWRTAQRLLLLQGVGAAIVAVILGLLLRGPHQALRQLTQAAQRLRHDPSVRVAAQPRAAPEYTLLAEAFNAMASEIEAHVQELAQAHQQAMAEAQRLRTILMSIGDAVVVADVTGRVAMLNASASRLLGVPQDQLLGRPLVQAIRLVDERTGSGVDLPRLCEVSGEQTPRPQAPVCVLAADGSRKPVDVSMATVRLPDGLPIGCVYVLTDVSARRAWEQQLAWQATHDALTGLPNRALLADRLGHALARARRGSTLVGVALLDLDEFKPVNDRMGHAAGDALLQRVAARAREVLRETDTLARLGGDEFAVVLAEQASADGIETTLQRLAAALTQPFDIQGSSVRVSASVGYTIYPLDESDTDTLLRHADEAMYAAKHAGRNRVCRHRELEPHLADAAHPRRALRQAMREGQLVWYYQPVVDLRRARIVGWEALVRWQHPQRGLLPPAEFMPWLDSPSLQRELDRLALADALRQLASWRRAGHDWLVSVNVSVAHFLSPDFADHLAQSLRDSAPELASALVVEVVESAALHDTAQAQRAAAQCRALGVRLAMDDFGVGYASLSQFKQVPWDVVKIDRSFVADLDRDWTDLATVQTVVDMARVFGRQSWAEGVEYPEQGVMLLGSGCDWVQGFGIARPMPAGDVLAWVNAWRPDPAWSEWRDVEWDPRDFPLLVARLDHMRWVDRVLATLQGRPLTLEEGELHDHRRCRLGQWVATRGRQRYGDLPAFAELQPVHEAVHRCGAELVRAVAAGEHEQARRCGERLRELQAQVLALLGQLQREVARRSTLLDSDR